MIHFASVCCSGEYEGHISTGNGSKILGGVGDIGCINVHEMAGTEMSTGVGESESGGSRFAARKSAFVDLIIAFVAQNRILAAMNGGQVALSVGTQDLGSAMIEWTSPVVVVLAEMFIEFVFALVATFASNDGAKITAIIGMYVDIMAR